jgi:hypothetical protein
MFQVQAHSLDEYFDADPARKGDLQALDALIRETVPRLERWFYPDIDAALRPDPLDALRYSNYRIVSSSVAQR